MPTRIKVNLRRYVAIQICAHSQRLPIISKNRRAPTVGQTLVRRRPENSFLFPSAGKDWSYLQTCDRQARNRGYARSFG
jgi:hypothetical protein